MKKNNRVRILLNIALLVYILVVLYITLLNRETTEQRYSFDLFYSYILLFKYKNDFYYDMIFYNILMLIPFGFLVPVLHPRCRKLSNILLLSFLFSLVIEVIQYITGRGLFEADDLFNNTIGGITGYFIYFTASRIWILLSRKRSKKYP